MKYLFAVIDKDNHNNSLYSIEASSIDEAQSLFVKKAFPILPDTFFYVDIVEMLYDNNMELICLGSCEGVIEL